jgi:hypothetical protein
VQSHLEHLFWYQIIVLGCAIATSQFILFTFLRLVKNSIFMVKTEKDKLQVSTNTSVNQETDNEKVLCPHCQRTATNGIKCKGICVADNDY